MDGGECANMENKKLRVRLLGECSITLGDLCVQSNGKRASKSWLLLAYLICSRNRLVPQEELAERLWGGESEDRHSGTLKTTVWRARQLLKPLAEMVGQELIVSEEGGYGWNSELPMEVDCEQFEKLCHAAEAAIDEDAKQEYLRQGLALYRGDFLAKFSTEEWAEPLAAYYYNFYITSVMELLTLLPPSLCAQEIVELCRAALHTAPYHEALYQYLMRGLIAQQESKKAEEVYEEMQQLLLNQLGVMPSEESQALLSEIQRQEGTPFLTAEAIREQLTEKDPAPGAFFCDYSVFKLFYQTEARSAFRRGDAVHVAVLSVKSVDGKELSQNSLERAMEQLRIKIQSGLRCGDVVARCSASQFILLLLQANYENSMMVCKRLTHAFMQAHPRSPVRIHCTVLPLEPMRSENLGREITLSGKKASWKI